MLQYFTMANYYTGKRTKNLFDPKSKEVFKLSRSKIDSFLKCPRCFYLDRRLGVGQPAGFPFNLNSAVDYLLKKEFDLHRAEGSTHPLMASYGVKAVPFAHKDMDKWRENFVGVQYLHQPTNFLVFGAVDDVWVNDNNELHIVDYKATAKDGEVGIEADWQRAYKNQMEIYQWLMKHNGFAVSTTGYFVYLNGKRDAKAFDGKLEFDIKIIPYVGDASWVDEVLQQAHACLLEDSIPPASPDCEYCSYRQLARSVES